VDKQVGSQPLVEQLGLAVQLPAHETFSTYHAGSNAGVVATLREFIAGDTGSVVSAAPWCVLTGGQGVGKSHLLHAICAEKNPVMYLGLDEVANAMPPQILDGLDHYSFVCIDDIDRVVQTEAWCLALFNLINRVSDGHQTRIIFTAKQPATHLSVCLPDLRSRLQWGLTLNLQQLTDSDKVRALQIHAQARGLQLAGDVAQFLLQRLSRSIPELLTHLETLDRASIAAQRRLTIPFVKRVLAI